MTNLSTFLQDLPAVNPWSFVNPNFANFSPPFHTADSCKIKQKSKKSFLPV